MLGRIKAKLREFLYYNKVETRGVLVFIILLFVFYSCFYFYERRVTRTVDSVAFFARVDSLEREAEEQKPKVVRFVFNPNTVDSSGLAQLGFTQKQIRMLLKYRRAGGVFRKKEDFKKLYFMNDSLYAVYSNYLKIPVEKKKIKKTQYFREKIVNKETKKDSLFPFNPNEISEEQWLLLGVKNRTVNVIKNYLAKGGSFRKKEDLKKIYGLSDEVYARLEKYIHIPKREKKVTKPLGKYDLNTITEEELQEIKVGKYMIYKLLKYREKLGGYVRMEQLREIPNLREWDLKQLDKYCELQSGVTRISINTDNVRDLYKHPYVDLYAAQDIVRYRKRKGDYTTIETLRTAKILKKEVFEKVKKYLTVKKAVRKIGK